MYAFTLERPVTLQDAAAQLMSTAGLDREVLAPLARAALENWNVAGAGATVSVCAIATGPARMAATAELASSDLSRDGFMGFSWTVTTSCWCEVVDCSGKSLCSQIKTRFRNRT